MMPGMDGFSLLQYMDKNHPGIPYVYTHSLPIGLYKEEPEASLYYFDEGRGNTKLDFRQSPEYQAIGEMWNERYQLSPTISPSDRITNTMPRAANTDQKGYLMATAQKRAEREMEGQMNVAQLLSASKGEIAEAESKGA